MAKGLTYQELMDLAKANYDRGGDRTYECWDEKTFDMYVELFGPITKKKALEMFRLDYSIAQEQKALMLGW